MLGNHWEDDIGLTNHARQRIQQRGISTEAVNAILAYGTRRRHRGTDIYFLDKKSRRRLAGAFGRERYSKLERALDSYVLVSDDGAIVTAAHRLHRLKF